MGGGDGGWRGGGGYRAFISSIRVFGYIVQELCESRGGSPGLPVLTILMVSVDVKQH